MNWWRVIPRILEYLAAAAATVAIIVGILDGEHRTTTWAAIAVAWIGIAHINRLRAERWEDKAAQYRERWKTTH